MAASADLRIFLDSNVIISGIYSPDGPPAKILNLHANAKLRIIVCQLVVEEVVRAIREKKPDALPALQLFLSNAPPEIIRNPPLKEVQRWINLLHFEVGCKPRHLQTDGDYLCGVIEFRQLPHSRAVTLHDHRASAPGIQAHCSRWPWFAIDHQRN